MRTRIVVVACLLMVSAPGWAEDATSSSWVIEPSISRLFGDTTYRLSAMVDDPNSPGTLTEIRSTLAFPLDTTLVGLAVRWQPSPERPRHWTFKAGASVNVNDPSNLMTDLDWIGDTQIAYTESDAELGLVLAAAEARYQIDERGRLSLLALFEYERISQNIIGFDGWIVNIDTGIPHDISGTDPAIDYVVTYASPQLGIRSAIELNQFTALAVECSAGLVFASDIDDHLLRGRLAEADAVGFGLHSSAELSLLPGSVLGSRISVALVGEFRHFNAHGGQAQRWYEDEGDIPAGTEVTGIPHEFRTYQYSIGLEIGFGT